jgi:hypothetical protein
MTLLLLSSYPATEHCVIDHQYDDRPDDCDDHAVEIEPGNPACAEGAEDEAADDGSHDAEGNVEEKALASFVDNLAGDEARDEAQDNPPDDRHNTPRLLGDGSG